MTNPPDLAAIVTRAHGESGGFSRHYLSLYAFVLGLRAKRVCEFGAGFSTVTILEALAQTGGSLITNDQRPIERTNIATELLAAHAARFEYAQGAADGFLARLKGEAFDLVLHDGSHEFSQVFRDLRAVLPRVKKDGLVLVHDTNHPTFPYLRYAATLALWVTGTRYEKVTLPYGCGLTVIRVLSSRRGVGAADVAWRKGDA
jgi:predicted O-methyltransferase YrrM